MKVFHEKWRLGLLSCQGLEIKKPDRLGRKRGGLDSVHPPLWWSNTTLGCVYEAVKAGILYYRVVSRLIG